LRENGSRLSQAILGHGPNLWFLSIDGNERGNTAISTSLPAIPKFDRFRGDWSKISNFAKTLRITLRVDYDGAPSVRSPKFVQFLTFMLVVIFVAVPVEAADASPGSATKKVIVGTKVAPPFVIRDSRGGWAGSSIVLWREIATDLELDYEFRESDLAGLLKGVEDGTLDVAVAALTVTSEREERFDFTHPFFTTGLGIVVRNENDVRWFHAFRALATWGFLKLVLGLGAMQFVVGTIVWLFERRKNPEQFGGSIFSGLAAAYWWATVTMTTVGYGDKAPRTVGGRIAALLWMLTSVIALATFTATVASQQTVRQLESQISGPADLVKVSVGTVVGTTSESYLKTARLNYQGFADLQSGAKALQEHKVDAIVYDTAMLEALVAKESETIRLLPGSFERQDYAIAVPTGSPLRERINRVLPEKIRH
jgi:ABC-type amino acid transport substrate-binding protein